MKGTVLLLTLVLAATIVPAQTTTTNQAGSCFPHCHECEVGVADLASKRILKTIKFSPLTGEEELTSKVFRIPGTNLNVIASVFYTDESMASKASQDSIQLGLAISKRSWPSAFASPTNAVSEVTLATFDTARVETRVSSGARRFFVSMECKDK